MDRRQQKTRNAIFDAFSQLLSKKNVNRISVQEIIDVANVGRTTFYSHFETKDFLLKELCKDLFTHILNSTKHIKDIHFHGCEAPDSIFLHLLYHLKNNDKNICKLLNCENNEIFLQYFKENLKILLEEYININANPELPKDFLLNHISSSLVETVSWWINNGLKESPETIEKYFLSISSDFLIM